jgi:hypothetical protein
MATEPQSRCLPYPSLDLWDIWTTMASTSVLPEFRHAHTVRTRATIVKDALPAVWCNTSMLTWFRVWDLEFRV